MRSTSFLLLALALAATVAGSAIAEDPSPADAYKAKVKSLPAPSKEAGFEFLGVMRLLQGEKAQRIGHARLSAAAVTTAAGEARWRVQDAIVIKMAAVPQADVATGELDAHLVPLSGSIKSNRPGEGGIRYVQTAKGYRAFRKTKTGDVETEEVRNYPVEGSVLTTMAGTALFARLALDTKANYATNILEIKDALKGDAVTKAMTMEIVGEKEMNSGHKVLVAIAKKGEKTMTLLFDPKSKELVSMRMSDPKMTLEIVKGDEFAMPATTPLAAGMRAAFAFATGQAEILDDLMHWETIYAAALKAKPKEGETPEITIDEFRNQRIAAWKKSLGKQPAAMIGAFLKGAKGQFKETKVEGEDAVLVDLPPMWRGLVVKVKPFGGIWHIVGMGNKNKSGAKKKDGDTKKDGDK